LLIWPLLSHISVFGLKYCVFRGADEVTYKLGLIYL
jgi:hypothetical protein